MASKQQRWQLACAAQRPAPFCRVENEWKGPNLWVAAALSPEKNNGPTHYNMCRLVMKKKLFDPECGQ